MFEHVDDTPVKHGNRTMCASCYKLQPFDPKKNPASEDVQRFVRGMHGQV